MEPRERMTWNEERIARTCIASFPGFGSKTLHAIKQRFPSFSQAWTSHASVWRSQGLSEKTVGTFLDWRNTIRPDVVIEQLEQAGARVLFPDEPGFPASLLVSSDPPEVLFIRGEIDPGPAVAIVGTRKSTSYGARCVELLVPKLVTHGMTIVSGLAMGIDTLAHEATIAQGGKTIAFLGTGVDASSIYPAENVSLSERILSSGGALLSEFPIGTPALKHHFPMRNRLIASYALATVVIEAAASSGSLITAKLALEENREVLAVPGPIWNSASTGSNHLLKLGAKPCTCAQDILEAIAIDRPELIREARIALPIDPQDLAILDILSEPRHIDELSRLAEMDISALSSQLTILELKGLVKPIGGQMWVRSGTSS